MMTLPDLGTAWARPGSLEEACSLLAEAGPAARPVAGCTVLTPAALARDRKIRLAVDLLAVPELDELRLDERELRIGAAVTIATLARDPRVLEAAPLLADAAAQVSDEVLRAMATVGGNVAAPLPSDLRVVLAALDASIVTASVSGVREIPLRELAPGSELDRAEIVTAIVIPPSNGSRWAYRKQTTNVHAFGVASIAAHVPAAGAPGAFAGVGTWAPQRLEALERMLATRASSDLRDAVDEAVAALSPASDVVASAQYRRRIVRALLTEELSRLVA